ncbi:MAG TPA: bifunctional isocitrate dehydrogenase kinase/phosphatase [Methylomirabilota bacterium]|nr:bifunctional isocitrate dehydrogenase kinase/phosphatase [Methylomirabilota bacterium]
MNDRPPRPAGLIPARAARSDAPAARRGAETVLEGFERHQRAFQELTRRAAARQERRDWGGMQRDAVERLELYGCEVTRTVLAVARALGDDLQSRDCWARMKAAYRDLVGDRLDTELARTFFNSVTRRVFGTVGVEPRIEYVDAEFDRPGGAPDGLVYSTYVRRGSIEALVRAALADRPLTVPYQDLDRDARLIAEEIETHRQAVWASEPIESVEVIAPVFYRNKGAYLIGRLRRAGGRVMPLVIALVNEDHRLVVDAVLLTEDEASIVFSFTRSAFHVDVPGPHGVIQFLRSIMPAKRVAELYIALGYHKHGKAELYRDLVRHLGRSTDRFEIAPGERGMVMVVFTLPSYDVVFKVIRDSFAPPKTVTHRQVLERYQLVFKHDRAGRLVDAQEFEHLAFPRERFSEALLAELQEAAAGSVLLDGDRVVIKHLYTERRVTPLNLHLGEADEGAIREAILDYGRAIRDMAATNIFPGDLLLKNFGVTRHGRVIFYDYDELCLLTDCNFREMPPARDLDEEMAAEPWFYVGPGDVFPEEFLTFMGLYGGMREVFLAAHGDLLTAAFWTRMQALHRAGEVVDIFPYRPSRRLRGAERERP